MNRQSTFTVLALLFATGCAVSPAEEGEDVATAAQAITPIPIPGEAMNPDYYAITPIPIPGAGSSRPVSADAITVDGSGITYLSTRYSGLTKGYSAVKVDYAGNVLAESQWIAGTVPSQPTNMVLDGNTLVFGSVGGKVTHVMPLNPLVKPTTRFPDPDGSPEVHGNGIVPLSDGTSADVFTVRGFAKASKLFPTTGCGPTGYECINVASDVTPGHRGFWQVGDHTLRNFAVGDTSTTTTANCSLLTSTYAPGSSITSAKDESTGRFHVAALTSSGKIAECRGSLGAGTVRILALPFAGVADMTFDTGGGKSFDATTTTWTGLWVASSSTAEIAYFPGGGTSAVKLALPGVPMQIVTSGKKAIVVTTDHKLYAIERRW